MTTIVATVTLPDGPTDGCYTWEAAQSMVLRKGAVAVAIADDGHMAKEDTWAR